MPKYGDGAWPVEGGHMREPSANRRLRAGSVIVFGTAIVLAVFSVVAVFAPMRGEEELAGTTFADLQASNPGFARVVWHYNAGIAVLVLGLSVLVAFLAWKELSRGSRTAWFTILFIGVTIAVALLAAHVGISHPDVTHWGPPIVLPILLLIRLAISAKPVLSGSRGMAA